MSGLFGIVSFAALRIEPNELRALAAAASYRAPGGIGYRCLGEAGLAHLARDSGDQEQPLFDSAGQVCGVLDGRLDNRAELIAQLAPAEGPAASDARLLLAAYLRWGEACTDHLLGDFAFALWDADRHRLLCAVDPLGIKPLHFARAGTVLCFASDAAQVLAHPAVPDGYDETEIAAYLASHCEDRERTFFAAVRRLAPGQRLIAEAGGLRVERYWDPRPTAIRYARDEEYAGHFRELLQGAVTHRLRDAGGSVAVAMSGGLDSTSVAALARRASGPGGVRAYTFAFDRLSECDERAYSRAMTEELGLEVEAVDAERLWSLESRVDVPFSPDTPFLGWRTCYQEIFRRMAEQGMRVLLTGHGGDDLLRGSSLIYAERLRRGDWGAVREVARHARGLGKPVGRAFYDYFGRPHLRPRERWSSSREVRSGLMETPWYWRVANWHERSSAVAGVEVRHPFLDRRLFEYVLAIPGEQLFRLAGYKNLLRRSMSGILPEMIRSRGGKTRFTSFLDFVLLGKAADEIQELLQAPRSADLGMLDKDRLRSAYQGLATGRRDVSRRALWYAITLEIWLRRWEVIRKSRRCVAGNRLAA